MFLLFEMLLPDHDSIWEITTLFQCIHQRNNHGQILPCIYSSNQNIEVYQNHNILNLMGVQSKYKHTALWLQTGIYLTSDMKKISDIKT